MKEGDHKKEEHESFPSAWVIFGAGGHEKEYTLNLEGFDLDKPIPREIELELKKRTGTRLGRFKSRISH